MRKLIALILLPCLSGCVGGYGAALMAQAVHEAPESIAWTEEVATIDGKIITLNGKRKYSTDLSTNFARDWYFEGLNPIAYDVVNNVPWVVAEAYGLDTCRKYGSPTQGLVFFKYDHMAWDVVPYDQAPHSLHVNLVLDLHEYRYGIYRSQDDGKNHHYYGKKLTLNLKKDINQSAIWRSKYFNKNGAGKNVAELFEERKGNTCPPPPIVLPPPQKAALELLKEVNYEPEKVINSGSDEWSHLSFDKKRRDYCDTLTYQVDPKRPLFGEGFVNDSTRKKRVPYSKPGIFGSNGNPPAIRICDKDAIWFIARKEEVNNIVLTKFSINGDLIYRVIFPKPEDASGFFGATYRGMIMEPTLRSENGYIYFDWIDFRNSKRGADIIIKRTQQVRIAEPHIKLPKRQNTTVT